MDTISGLKPKALEAGYKVEEETKGNETQFYFVHDDFKSCAFPNETAAWLAAGQHADKHTQH